MATQAELQQAQAALHALVTGGKAVKVQKDGRSVEYAPINKPDLENYIQLLKVELGVGQVRRPMRVYIS